MGTLEEGEAAVLAALVFVAGLPVSEYVRACSSFVPRGHLAVPGDVFWSHWYCRHRVGRGPEHSLLSRSDLCGGASNAFSWVVIL